MSTSSPHTQQQWFNPYRWTESQFRRVLSEPRIHKLFERDHRAIREEQRAADLRPLTDDDYKNLPGVEIIRRLKIQSDHEQKEAQASTQT